jgi:hypothetical protein
MTTTLFDLFTNTPPFVPPRQPRTFFRENRSAQEPFEPFSDDKFIPYNADLDVGGGCGDSCEIGADED